MLPNTALLLTDESKMARRCLISLPKMLMDDRMWICALTFAEYSTPGIVYELIQETILS
jgi:hypothetical protein